MIKIDQILINSRSPPEPELLNLSRQLAYNPFHHQGHFLSQPTQSKHPDFTKSSNSETPILINSDSEANLALRQYPRLIVDSNQTICDHKVIKKCQFCQFCPILSKWPFWQNRQFWQFLYRASNLYTGLYTTSVYNKLTILTISYQFSKFHEFHEIVSFHHNMSTFVDDSVELALYPKWQICPKWLILIKNINFDQNWQNRQFWQFHPERSTLYTGLYTSPGFLKPLLTLTPEIPRLHCSEHLQT